MTWLFSKARSALAIWVWLLDTQYGLINHYLAYLGLDGIPWLTSTDWSLIGVSIASIWWDMGLAFVLFLAALQDIPRDLLPTLIDLAMKGRDLDVVKVELTPPTIDPEAPDYAYIHSLVQQTRVQPEPEPDTAQ